MLPFPTPPLSPHPHFSALPHLFPHIANAHSLSTLPLEPYGACNGLLFPQICMPRTAGVALRDSDERQRPLLCCHIRRRRDGGATSSHTSLQTGRGCSLHHGATRSSTAGLQLQCSLGSCSAACQWRMGLAGTSLSTRRFPQTLPPFPSPSLSPLPPCFPLSPFSGRHCSIWV